MSFFMRNTCHFNNCLRTFQTLHGLIKHIEDTHIDFSPEVMEKVEKERPQCVPMSYILRYNRGMRIEDESDNGEILDTGKIKTDPSEVDQTPLDHKDYFQNPIWLALNKCPPMDSAKEKIKRFTCPIKGCSKRYKNQNGMKYHIMNHHDVKGTRPETYGVMKSRRKEHKCSLCGREYKTTRGLQSHMLATHNERLQHEQPRSPLMNVDSFRMPSKMNCMLPNVYPLMDNYNSLIVKTEEAQRGYPAGGNLLASDVHATIVRTQVYRNPFYFDFNLKNPME